MINRKIRNSKFEIRNFGQSLFEVTIALGVMALVILGLISLSSTSVSNVDYSRNKTVATRYAQELSEWLRGQRDELGWRTFVDGGHVAFLLGVPRCAPSIGDWSSTLHNNDCGSGDEIDGIYYRSVEFATLRTDPTSPVDDTVEATVRMEWMEGDRTFDFESTTRLTNWQLK